MPLLDIVICTYNRAASLAATLDSLAAQNGVDRNAWTVLVVDNASNDDTRAVAQKAGVRCVPEEHQGLVHARRRGLLESDAPWVAFVDDDCLLQPDWVAKAIDFIDAQPQCGAFGGRVILQWVDSPPRFIGRYLYSFAAQDHGSFAQNIGWLVGAGLVLRRSALLESGWMERQYLGDRAGAQLLSGGDMEMVLRIRGAGYALWYTPACVLSHVIAPGRMRVDYLVALNYGLGISQVLCDLMQFSNSYYSWLPAAASETLRSYLTVGMQTIKAIFRRRELADISLTLGFAQGRAAGLIKVLKMDPSDRQSLLGCAHANRTAAVG
jgi:glycosyltransferase involved in cell wall biosynthesis